MSHAENKVRWCLNKAQKELQEGKKHRGLIETAPDTKKAQEHIIKAEHNLKATLYLYKGGFSDWCSSSIFYAIYHCFLAILAKFGYESKNQECTIAIIESLVEDGKIALKKEDIEKVSRISTREEFETSPTLIAIREEYQYGTKVTLENRDYEELLQLAKKVLDKTKSIIII